MICSSSGNLRNLRVTINYSDIDIPEDNLTSPLVEMISEDRPGTRNSQGNLRYLTRILELDLEV